MQYMARVGHDCSKQPLFSRLNHLRRGGASSERHPALRSLLTWCSSLSLSRMVVKPHHTGKAYSREAMVVARATSWSCCWGAHESVTSTGHVSNRRYWRG